MLLQAAAHILCYDLWFYASHLLLHTKALWPIHKIHHEKLYPTWTDTYHGHWFESAFQGIGYFIPFLLFDPVSYQVAAVTLVLINARGMLRHDPRGSFLVGDHHLLHHTKFTCNYGEPWLDTLFGTRVREWPCR